MRKTVVASFASAAALLALGSASASAGEITPTTTADEAGTGAACSLREAVQAANTDSAYGGCPAGSGTDTIRLGSGKTYNLAHPGVDDANAFGDLDLVTPINLIAGRLGAVIDGSGAADRVLEVEDPVTVVRVEIRDGATAQDGGGIRVGGDGLLTMRNGAIADNITGSNGGGIAIGDAGTIVLENVTIASNRAGDDGGGIYDDGFGDPIVASSTIVRNVADNKEDNDGDGGGISPDGGSVVQMRNSILALNTDASPAGTVAPDCGGQSSINSQGYNVLGDDSVCAYDDAVGDRVNVDPRVGALLYNGGPARTVALLGGSPAINRGRPGKPASGPSSCPVADERGISRRVGGRCDIGAYEMIRCAGAPVTRIGTGGPDRLVGSARRDGILGYRGNDRLLGLGNKDGLCGGPGRDRLAGGPGRDLLLGQRGFDRLLGGGGPDRLVGGPQADRLYGGARRDTLFGGGGRDLINGGRGPDLLFGGPGGDRLIGGRAFDRCIGGGGVDVARRCEFRRSVP